MVGDDGGWTYSLLSMSASLPHRRRAAWILFQSQERGQGTGPARLRTPGGTGDGSDREEATQSLLPGHANPLDGTGRLQHGLRFLPEYRHLEGEGGPRTLGT